MELSLRDVLKCSHQRRIISINVDYLEESPTQNSESYQVIQMTELDLYVVLHHIGSKIVGIMYVGDNLQTALLEAIQYID